VLLVTNALAFALQWLSRDALTLWGAKVNALIAAGQLWRLLTSSLLHTSLFHLLVRSLAGGGYGLLVRSLAGGGYGLLVRSLAGGGYGLLGFSAAAAAAAAASLLQPSRPTLPPPHLPTRPPQHQINSHALHTIGPHIEMVGGRSRFTAVYLAGALVGTTASFMFTPAPSVGASGV